MRWMPHLFCLLLVPAAHAEPWLCVMPDGNKQFSYEPESARMKNCVHHPIPSGNVWRARPSRAAGPEASPAAFPKVDPGTQRKRDAFRREILLRELAQERASLATALSALAEQKQSPAVAANHAGTPAQNLKPLHDRIRVHQTNIVNLQKELGAEG